VRVLLTTPTYPPHNSGLGNAVRLQAQGLVRRGLEVTIATGSIDGRRVSEMGNGIVVERFALSGAAGLLRPIRGDSESYTSFLAHGNFDAVVLNAWQNWATDLAFQVIDHLPGRKVLYSHCISTNLFLPTQPLRSVVRYLAWRPYWWSLPRKLRRLDDVIFLAEDGDPSRFGDVAIARRIGVPMHVIANSVEPGPSIAPLPLEERPFIMSVGSYTWQKGFDQVLRMYARSSAHQRYTLRLFGQEKTAYADDLRQLATELGISERVSFNSGVEGAALQSEYQQASLFLMGSRTECQPLVLLDAMAAGVPFVALRTGCVAQMRGGTAVATVEDGAAVIDADLSDLSRWNELSVAGRATVTRFHDAERNADRLLEVLQGKVHASAAENVANG